MVQAIRGRFLFPPAPLVQLEKAASTSVTVNKARQGKETMTKEETKALVERVRKAKNREVMSEFIRLGQSDLYDWQETRRAVLKEIAFLQVNDEQTKVPERSPFKGQYTGWCYASQKFIACRVGCSDRWVRNCVKVFEKDGVIETRTWADHLGYPHKEYHVIEDVVTAHQRPKEYLEEDRNRPQRGGNKKANAGSFKLGNKARSHRNGQPLPQEASAVGHRNGQPNAIGSDSRKPQEHTAVSDTADSSVKPVVVQRVPSVAPLPQDTEGLFFQHDNEARAKASDALRRDGQGGGASALNMKNLKPMGTVTEAKKKQLPNRLCYPEAFKDCYDNNGKWIPGRRVPRCHRCDGLLHPNENHVCEGYIPKLPFEDMADHMERMEEQRESMREELHGHRQAMREERIMDAWEREEEDIPTIEDFEELEEQDAEF